LLPGNESKQAIRIRRFLIAASSYSLIISLASYYFLEGLFRLELSAFNMLIGGIIVTNLIFLLLFRTGTNKRFTDPGLTMPQMLSGILWIMAIVYYTNDARGILLSLNLVVFAFGIFKLKIHHFLVLALLTVVGYACMVSILVSKHPDTIDLQLESLRGAVLATALILFSFV